MRKFALLTGLALVVLVAISTSGQGRIEGRVVRKDSQPLAGCEVDRDGRVGFALGGLDFVQHLTGDRGTFSIPVDRGWNRLRIECRGLKPVSATAFVLRGRDAEIFVVVEG